MTKYKFKAKDIRTGEYVEGDLVYVRQIIFRKGIGVECGEKPMIVKLKSHGGMIYATSRYYIDENTLELSMKTKNTFIYDGRKFQYVEKHNNRCDGCWFWDNDISCIPKEIAECKSGIFVEVKENS